MKNLLIVLAMLVFCLPSYGVVLVYKYSDVIDYFDLVEIIEPADPNDPNIYDWDVLIKGRVKGYLVADVNYDDFTIRDAALIAYWSNKGSATTGNLRGKFQETIELENLELVRITQYPNKVYGWVFVDTQNLEDGPGMLMLSGKARIQDIGLRRDKREIAKSMTGYILGDTTEGGREIGALSMGKVAARFDKKWTRIANLDPNYGGFGGSYEDFLDSLDTKSIKGYLRKRGHVRTYAMLDAPEWVDVNDSNSSELFLDWTDVPGAKKYSVDIEGTVTYFDPNSQTRISVEVELSFGTSDRTDGGSMKDSDLTIYASELDYAVVYALFEHGVDPMILRRLTTWQLVGRAKVKALNPGKGSGRQNHPFSEWSEEFEVTSHLPD
ncbi:MAG: hypothetical protein ACYTBJ_21000 [Planctomycetota bacterium]